MPVSSLPSPYGIGSFGKGAFDFIDFLSECGQTCWQVLPLNPTSYGDSPYQSPASIAGNPYFIDIDILVRKRLIKRCEAEAYKNDGKRVDYGTLFNTRYPLLRLAYSRFTKNDEFRAFLRANKDWLGDYSLFMALKVHYGHRAWTEWAPEHRDVRCARACAKEFSEECGFWSWVQYEFMSEWRAVLDYAHTRGIKIIGDMPIYVAHDSMDVWRAPIQFALDEEFSPIEVAGCPPDGFSPDGQLWGNPLYNWERMRADGFTWWIDRVKKSLKLYDLLRIDHFRGFAGFYAIPYGDTTARGGRWVSAPGKELFDAVRSALPRAKIIAEDLGFITDDVRELLAYTAFPGMKILQFAFYDENSEYLPRTYATDNCIVYTGSHDSDCTATWVSELGGDAVARFKKECKRRKGQSATEALIELAMSSRANLAIIPMQDYLELKSGEGRMNIPSVAEGNWSWRISPRYRTKKLVERIKGITERAGREV